ncbi:MAG: radical SAM protein [Anaerolineaceae bacterium]|nr:radical SAM protein [Anaerolineaceae bacterium]
MMKKKNLLPNNKIPKKPPESGIYHYQIKTEEFNSRIHLRVEEDGSGFMLLNANNIYFMNPTAMFMAYLKMEGASPAQVYQRFKHLYNVEKADLETDYIEFENIFYELSHATGKCPLCDLHLETLPPNSQVPLAPYRMDLALSYQCNNNCGHCYNARPRNFPEMSTAEWKRVLDHCWEIGIPHIIFTGGEPTLRKDLPELIAYAEHLGQITGINTNGRLLANKTFVQQLVDAGLDHVQITIESYDAAVHDQMQGVPGVWQQTVEGIKNVVASPLYMMTNTTMLSLNHDTIPDTLDFLADLGVPTVGLNALIHSGRGTSSDQGLHEPQIEALLEVAKEKTTAHQQRLIWYTPTQYCHFNPILQGVGAKGCSAARYNMCIEPNGDVLPCQSYYQSVGNFLETDWDDIWHHPLCESIRNRDYVPQACKACALLDECGGGCPLAYTANAYKTPYPFGDQLPEELELMSDEIPK